MVNEPFARPRVWAVWYFAGMLVVRWLYRRYQRERALGEPEVILRRWSPRIHGMALIYGSSMAVPPLLMVHHATFEFQLLCLVTISEVIKA